MKQNPPRTHKEVLQDMGHHLTVLRSLARNLAERELPALALAALPDGRERVRLLAACASNLAEEPARVLPGDASATALAMQEILVTAAAMLSDLEGLDALRREPFEAAA
jgi:nitroreductase